MSKGHQLEMYRYAAAKSLQSCPTLCNPIDGSPPGSAIPGILQARTLEWVAISFSSAWKWKVKVKSLSRVWLFETPWTAAYQAPPSIGFSRQEYWSGLPLPSPCTDLSWSQRVWVIGGRRIIRANTLLFKSTLADWPHTMNEEGTGQTQSHLTFLIYASPSLHSASIKG